jgi:hypothetical protein
VGACRPPEAVLEARAADARLEGVHLDFAVTPDDYLTTLAIGSTPAPPARRPAAAPRRAFASSHTGRHGRRADAAPRLDATTKG